MYYLTIIFLHSFLYLLFTSVIFSDYFVQQFIIWCSITVHSGLLTISSLQFLSQRTETLFTGRETLLELINIACNQPTNYASKSRETYYTKNTELKETERDKTEKLSTETEKQTN